MRERSSSLPTLSPVVDESDREELIDSLVSKREQLDSTIKDLAQLRPIKQPPTISARRPVSRQACVTAARLAKKIYVPPLAPIPAYQSKLPTLDEMERQMKKLEEVKDYIGEKSRHDGRVHEAKRAAPIIERLTQVSVVQEKHIVRLTAEVEALERRLEHVVESQQHAERAHKGAQAALQASHAHVAELEASNALMQSQLAAHAATIKQLHADLGAQAAKTTAAEARAAAVALQTWRHDASSSAFAERPRAPTPAISTSTAVACA